MHRALLTRICLLLAFLSLAQLAHAETAETKERSVLRLKPDRKARIVDRVLAGRKLLVLALSPDGEWAHVSNGSRVGWLPVAQLKGKSPEIKKGPLAATPPEEKTAPAPAAPSSGWTSGGGSKFSQEDTRVKVVVPQAEVYGRPAQSGAPLAMLRQGEMVNVLKKSADKNWFQVDLGGGESGWIEAKNVRGAAPAPTAKAPPPAKTPVAKANGKTKTPPSDVVVDNTPPPTANPRDKAPMVMDIDTVPAPEAPTHASGRTRFHIGAALGVGSLTQTFTSNGDRIAGDYTNYTFTSVGMGARVDMTLSHQFGEHLVLGIDAAYAYAGLTSFKLALPPVTVGGPRANGSLSVAAHQVDALPFVALKFAHDLEIRLHVGFDMQLNLVSGGDNAMAQLPSDRTLAMSTGLTLAVPRLFEIAGRPFGLIWYGSFIGPANFAQNDNDGTTHTTLGGSGGLFLKYGLFRDAPHGQVSLQIGWDFGVLRTKFHGDSERNSAAFGNVTEATRWSQHHLGLAGIDYTF